MAAVDVGTNTVRLLVAGRDCEGRTIVLLRERRITSMGKALRGTGLIGKEEFASSIDALRAFRASMDRAGAVRCRAVGTAALREAKNGAAFLAAARSEGIPLEVIGAREEGILSFRGALLALGGKFSPFLLMDIGGGSTELTAGTGDGETVSLPVGVVVTLGIHALSDPPSSWQSRNLALFYRERIDVGASSLPKRGFRFLAGTAGTFTTLAALDLRMKRYDPARIGGHTMSIERVKEWRDRLLRLTERERLALPGMEKGRERYIVPGAMQAVAAMERFRLDRLVVSDAGILEGIVLDLFEPDGNLKGEHKWKRA